jgi:hypothetical protein
MIQRRPTAESPLAQIFNVSEEEKARRTAGLLKLMDEWLTDESGYDERELPQLERALEENRQTSGNYRKLYPQ